MKDDKRLKRKVRNSYLISTVSMALVLFLLGSVGYLMLTAMSTARSLKETITVTVELQNGLTPGQRDTIAVELAASELVRSVAFVSKEEKLEDAEFRRFFDAQFDEVLGENPLLDSFELTVRDSEEMPGGIDAFLRAAGDLPGVAQVSFPVQLVEQLQETVNKIRLILLLFSGALLVVSLILLHNTIRLAIFSKRYIINTMKLVGATKWFIMKPFLASSIRQGLWAGIGASLLFAAGMYGLNETVAGILTVGAQTQLLTVLGAMIAGGIGLSLLFTWTALNRFINMKSNKIHLF